MSPARRYPTWAELRSDLENFVAAALAAADPGAAVLRSLRLEAGGLRCGAETVPLAPESRLWLVAAGKAARGMASAAWSRLGERVAGAVVVHPHGAPAAPEEPIPWPSRVTRLPAAHPYPDAASLEAGLRVERLLAASRPGDVVLVLLSGGASSLLELPRAGLGLDSLRIMTERLQRAGVDIGELNTVRRALSRLKGGGLARLAAPARVVTLSISDVLGDSPEAIASGPTVPSSTGPEEAMAVLERYHLLGAVPEVDEVLSRSRGEAPPPTPPGIYQVMASNRLAAEAVVRAAEERGYHSRLLTTFLSGEAREVGRVVGGFAASVATHGIPIAAPACLVFGGETTVTVRGEGRGGRNLELALGAAVALAGLPRSAVLAFATDGVDGASGAAGALATGDTLERAARLGWSAHRALAESNTEPFFASLGDLWTTGPTGTNVNDLALALVLP